MKTTESEEFRKAIHLSKLIPLGKKKPAKREAVHRLVEQWKLMLKVV